MTLTWYRHFKRKKKQKEENKTSKRVNLGKIKRKQHK
jgi:hypothetical protein